LQQAGWDNEPHSIAEQRTITDGRIIPVGKGFVRKPPKRVDYLLRYLTCVANQELVLPTWLALYFRTPPAIQQLAAASPGSADRNRTLSMDGLRAVRVPLPPIADQHRIIQASSLNRVGAPSVC